MKFPSSENCQKFKNLPLSIFFRFLKKKSEKWKNEKNESCSSGLDIGFRGSVIENTFIENLVLGGVRVENFFKFPPLVPKFGNFVPSFGQV